MSFAYFNPYATSAPSRSTFTAAMGSTSAPCLVMFNGLPPDVTEKDLRDVLLSELSLASSTTVSFLHASDGKFMGMALVAVSNPEDAEKLRRQYSGVSIDNTYRLSVQHILPPTQPLPTPQVQPFVPPVTAARNEKTARPPPTQPARSQQAKSAGVNSKPGSDKPPGLQLLSRLNKPGPPGAREKQAALIAQQKANLKLASSQPGKSLLNRLARSSKPGTTTPKASPGTDKINRAKKGINNSMDVDRSLPAGKGKEKTKAKTQEELDEEMRAWERQRRFA